MEYLVMPLSGVREYVEAANLAHECAHSEQDAYAKQIWEEIERSYNRLLEYERWRSERRQYDRPFAHFGLFDGR